MWAALAGSLWVVRKLYVVGQQKNASRSSALVMPPSPPNRERTLRNACQHTQLAIQRDHFSLGRGSVDDILQILASSKDSAQMIDIIEEYDIIRRLREADGDGDATAIVSSYGRTKRRVVTAAVLAGLVGARGAALVMEYVLT
jgi:hypothetical protein